MIERIELVACSIAAVFAIVFALYWIANPSEPDGTTFRDWWRNRPTIRDPERWERYLREKGPRG